MDVELAVLWPEILSLVNSLIIKEFLRVEVSQSDGKEVPLQEDLLDWDLIFR